MFTDKKYMEFKDIQLNMPLSSVKQAEKGKDVLIAPDSIISIIKDFLNNEKINYNIIENPVLCLLDDIRAGMQRYMDIDGSYDLDDAALLISPFDKDALFQWSLQVFGASIDPSYRAFLDSERKRGEDYYNHLYEFRP